MWESRCATVNRFFSSLRCRFAEVSIPFVGPVNFGGWLVKGTYSQQANLFFFLLTHKSILHSTWKENLWIEKVMTFRLLSCNLRSIQRFSSTKPSFLKMHFALCTYTSLQLWLNIAKSRLVWGWDGVCQIWWQKGYCVRERERWGWYVCLCVGSGASILHQQSTLLVGDRCTSIAHICISMVSASFLPLHLFPLSHLVCLPLFLLGVYISRSSYVRAGEKSLDGLYKPLHTVVYYRYLRFFPDSKLCGQTLCLLSLPSWRG